MLRIRDRGGRPCREVRALAAEKLAGLEAHLEELTVLRDELRALVATWDDLLVGTPKGKPAHLLDRLLDHAAPLRAPVVRVGWSGRRSGRPR